MPIPKKTETLLRTTAKERVYNTLRQWIIDGTMLPDERLNDKELAQYFSVSRTPVREALQMLMEQKLVTIIPSSGTYVAPIDQEDMVYVYQLLIRLQTTAIELIINKLSSAELAQLASINEAFLQHANHDSASDMTKADFDFHHYLAQYSGNPYLITFSDNLIVKACRNENRFFKQSRNPQISYEHHQKIIEALHNKDISMAQKMIQINWEVSFCQK
jgi:Transcriptional regulators